MTWYRCGGGGIPSSLKTDMNTVYNKKFGTSADYPPADWAPTVNLMGPLPEKTIVSSPIAHITDGADDVPIKSWQVEIAPTLDGVSSVTETQTGVNLFDNTSLFPASGSVSSYYFKQFDYNSNLIPLIKLQAGVTYTFSLDITSTIEPFNFSVGCGNGSYSSDILTVYNKSNGRISITFTPTTAQLSNGDIFAFRCPRYQAQNTFDYSVSNVQLEVGSSASSYSPYVAPTVSTVNLGRTIYGGTVDVVKGEGESRYGIVDLGTLTWTKRSTSSGHWRFTTQDIPIIINDDNSHVPDIASVDYTAISPTQSYNGITGITCNTNISQLMVCDESYSDASAFSTAMSGKYIVYPLIEASQTDFTFTPITPTPETALGVNNFWADEGDSSVTYRADINLALGGQ